MAKEDNVSLAVKLQSLFNSGATFPIGQPIPLPSKGKWDEGPSEEQPVLSGCKVVEARDGGAWIGFTTQSGIRCRTVCPTQTKKLRDMLDDIENVVKQGHVGETGIHLQRAGNMATV